jgi:ABC-type transport system substrate-binding protein
MRKMRLTTRTRKGWISGILAGALLLAACGGSATPAAGTTGSAAASSTATAATTTPAGGQTLIYGTAVPVTNLDTATTNGLLAYPASPEAAFLIYDGLVRFDSSLKIQPDLATSWSVAADGKTWTFHLRTGVKFTDGTPFDAQAAVFNLNRMISPTTNNTNRPIWDIFASAKVIDASTIELVTKAPSGQVLNDLAHASALMVSPAAVQKYGKDYGIHPVGTGPYMVKSFQPGTELDLVANPNYWGGKPNLAGIDFKSIPDSATRIAALQSGQVDVIDTVPPENVAQLQSDPSVKVLSVPGLQTFGVVLNELHAPLNDPLVRQAFNYAVDKAGIVKTLFQGQATVMDAPLAPSTTGHAAQTPYPYDPAKAKSLLQQAGYTAGSGGVLEKGGKPLSLTLAYPTTQYPAGANVAQAIQSELQQIGVQVKLNPVDSASFFNSLRVPPSQMKFDMVLFGFNPSNADGGYQLDSLYASNPTPTALKVWNFGWYSNASVDKLVQQADVTTDPATRDGLLAQAEAQIWKDAPVIWLYVPSVVVATRSNVSGVEVLPIVFTILNNASK